MTHIPRQPWLIKSDMAEAYEQYVYWSKAAASSYLFSTFFIYNEQVRINAQAASARESAQARRARDAYMALKAALFDLTGEVFDTPHIVTTED